MSNFAMPRLSWRTLATGALMVGLVGCTAAPGSGCSPTPPTTSVPGESTTSSLPIDTTTSTEPGPTTTTVPGDGDEIVPVTALGVSDCLIPVGDDLLVAEVQLVDCDDEHHAEVVAVFDVEDGELPDAPDTPGYPGGAELTWFAQDECQTRFESAVGVSYWDSPYDLKVISPSFSTWDLGDRQIACLAIAPDGGVLTGPVRSD